MQSIRFLTILSCALLFTAHHAQALTWANSLSSLNAILNEKKPTIVFIHTSWCAPCKRMAEFWPDIAAKHPEIKFVDVDGDKAKDVCEKYKVSCYPTIIFFDKTGKILYNRQGGFTSAHQLQDEITRQYKIQREMVCERPKTAPAHKPKAKPAPSKKRKPEPRKSKAAKSSGKKGRYAAHEMWEDEEMPDMNELALLQERYSY